MLQAAEPATPNGEAFLYSTFVLQICFGFRVSDFEFRNSARTPVPIDLDDLFRRGGQPLIDLMQYCVYAVRMEPLFAFLVHEYRRQPTPAAAVGLYEVFCMVGAPARIRAEAALPPRDLRLVRSIEPLRQATGTPSPEATEVEQPRLVNPSKTVFDYLLDHFAAAADSPLAAAAQEFDPSRTPLENLPGGKMTAGQRAFVDNVWRPVVRPRLVAAGFWRVGAIGG